MLTGTLSHAIAIAAEIHEGQVDKCGQPYILHPLRVMQMVASRLHHDDPLADVLRIVAVLHDVLEDGFVAQAVAEDVESAFSAEIVSALRDLTRRDNEDYLNKYLDRVSSNPIAVCVKLADLADNLDVRRSSKTLHESSAERAKREAKYFAAHAFLTKGAIELGLRLVITGVPSGHQ